MPETNSVDRPSTPDSNAQPSLRVRRAQCTANPGDDILARLPRPQCLREKTRDPKAHRQRCTSQQEITFGETVCDKLRDSETAIASQEKPRPSATPECTPRNSRRQLRWSGGGCPGEARVAGTIRSPWKACAWEAAARSYDPPSTLRARLPIEGAPPPSLAQRKCPLARLAKTPPTMSALVRDPAPEISIPSRLGPWIPRPFAG